jgi:hypothetical protein
VHNNIIKITPLFLRRRKLNIYFPESKLVYILFSYGDVITFSDRRVASSEAGVDDQK